MDADSSLPRKFPVAVFKQIILDSPFGNNSASDLGLIALALIIGVGLPLFIHTASLDTEVIEDGLRICFRLFHLK